MAEKSVFDQIKKQNGESFAKAIRTYDNGIFDIPNIVNIVKYAGREAEPLMQYLISLKKIKIEDVEEVKDPFELLSDAGYDAYYATNLNEQNRISKYFEPNEMLCTFRDPSRFQRYHIINAVKKNVSEIKREDFRGKEQREDAYGTSVISIQVAMQGGFISIKNRYNHSISNPDNTFNSNPDNIIKGLSNSLKKYLQVDFSSSNVSLPNNFVNINNQIVRYHIEENNVYFADSYYAKDGNIFPLNKDNELMLDTCILNIKNRTLYDPSCCLEPISIDNIQEKSGSFVSVLAHELKGKSLQIVKSKDGGHSVFANGKTIISVKNGEITALNLPNTTIVGDDFLRNNKALQILNAQNLTIVGNNFLYRNENLQILNTPNLIKVGDNFLWFNKILHTLNAQNLTIVGNDFLHHNETLQILNTPNLTKVGDGFLWFNKILHTLNAQNLTIVGNDFLRCNKMFKTLDMHKLTTVGCCFLQSNKILQILNAQNLTTVGDYFLWFNENLQILNTPKLKRIGKISSTLKALLQKAQTRNPSNNKKLNIHKKNTVTISVTRRKNTR
ncbi:MAG: hypothetical protein IJY58_01225 [Alphaproteobacteria bacterium]|nr:hypothetical protein [Alphaproteobacteria bacterium]